MPPTSNAIEVGDRIEAILASHRCPQRLTFVNETDTSITFSVRKATSVLALPVFKEEVIIALGCSQIEIGEALFDVQQITIKKAKATG